MLSISSYLFLMRFQLFFPPFFLFFSCVIPFSIFFLLLILMLWCQEVLSHLILGDKAVYFGLSNAGFQWILFFAFIQPCPSLYVILCLMPFFYYEWWPGIHWLQDRWPVTDDVISGRSELNANMMLAIPTTEQQGISSKSTDGRCWESAEYF